MDYIGPFRSFGDLCYELLFTPLFFLIKPAYSTPVATQSVLPITSDLPEEDITNALEQLYNNLTHFLTSHHTPDFDLLSHQTARAQPRGPQPNLQQPPSHCHYPCYEDTIALSSSSYSRIVTLPNSIHRLDLVTHSDSV
jgi:hypothetical protein